MSFVEEKYMVTGHHGDTYSLTAKQLYERILDDSKSDYNWIASASELVRICKKTSFPAEYALAIKCAILNCFTNIEHRANCGGDRYIDKPADQEAVQECYNSLYQVEDEKAISGTKVKLRFTLALNLISAFSFSSLNVIIRIWNF